MSPIADPSKPPRGELTSLSEATTFHQFRDQVLVQFARLGEKIAELRGDHRDISVKVDDVDRKVDAMRDLQESRWEETRRHRERQGDLALERHEEVTKAVVDLKAELRHRGTQDSLHEDAIAEAKREITKTKLVVKSVEEFVESEKAARAKGLKTGALWGGGAIATVATIARIAWEFYASWKGIK